MRHKIKYTLVVSLCLLISAGVASAQSGRKQKKVEQQPPVQGVNQPDARTQPEPEVTPEKQKSTEPRRSIMVASGMPDMSIPLYIADLARQGFIAEVRREIQSIDLREERNQTRSDAIKMAKQEDQMIVVLLEIELDRMGTTMSGVDLRYSVYEPKTGKVLAMGNGYPQQPSGMGIPPIGASRQQVYVEWQGRDAARQVLKRLNIIP